MKRQMRNKLIITTLVLSFMLTGCQSGKTETSNEKETNYYSISIDGDRKNYDEENQDVQSLKEFTNKVIEGNAIRDYKKSEQLNCYGLYVSETRKQYEEMNMAANLQKSVEANQFVSTLDDSAVHSIQFYTLRGAKAAEIIGEFTSTMENGTEEYLASLGLEKGSAYKRTLTITAVQEDNEWRIVEYSGSAREKVTK